MSSHDYVIANDTGANVRADLNLALLANQSQNSGTSEPSTTYAYQFWADTTTGILKQRNAANNAWISILTLSTGAPSAGGGIASLAADTTPQLGGDLDCNGAQIQWSKGADVASATALVLLTDGNYFDVTGTTTITSMNTTGGAGTLIKLHFDGALTLTHHATDLILPSGANITTAAGDEAEFIEYASGDYRCTNYTKASGAPVKILDNSIDLAQIASGTDGELITWDASGDPAKVAVGTATHILTSNGAGAAPTFQAAAGGGLLLAVASVTKTDTYTSTATSWTDIPTLTLTITPATSGNKFLISTTCQACNMTSNSSHWIKLVVDGTPVAIGDSGGSSRARASTGGNVGNVSDASDSNSAQFLYTTTGGSAHTIKVQHIVGGGTFALNRTQGDNSDTIYYGRAVSTLTVMEIDV